MALHSDHFFGRIECVGHSFANVAHFVFLRDVWIRNQRAAVASRRYQLSHPSPYLAKHLSSKPNSSGIFPLPIFSTDTCPCSLVYDALVLWSSCPLVFWFSFPLVFLSSSPLVLWSSCPLVLWSSCPLAFYGPPLLFGVL
jgi:hypothetical protein